MTEERHGTSQVIGGVLAGQAQARSQELAASLARQEQALHEALDAIDEVRDFVGRPENILGRTDTKHGEIAEHVEVGVQRAKDFLHQQTPTATFDGVGRTAAADYLIDGVAVQSKFINGARNTLDHVLQHMGKYEQFGRDGSYYHIPKDQHELISRLLRGDGDPELADRSIRAILAKVRDIEQATGKSFEEIVRPGVSRYSEVVRGNVHETLDNHERQLRDDQQDLKSEIEDAHKPGLADAAKAVGIGAAIGGGIKLALVLWEKKKQGRNIFRGELTAEDWKDVGLATVKGAAFGGVASGSIYALTTYTNMSAPFAAGIVSTTAAVAQLHRQYQRGEIDQDTFTELGLFSCIEGGITAACSAIGQTLIPIPVVGALIGVAAGKVLTSVTKRWLGGMDKELQQILQAHFDQAICKLDREHRELLKGFIQEIDRLGELTDAAFDIDLNTSLRLDASIRLAKAHKVPESLIIHDTDELDAFMLE